MSGFGRSFFGCKKMKLETIVKFVNPIRRDDGSEIDSILVKPFTASQHKTLPKKEKLTLSDEIKYIIASTGLSEKELDKLTVPDYNALVDASFSYIVEDGYSLASETLDSRKKSVVLYWQEGREIKFSFPKLKHSRMAEEITDPFERTIFILEQITDLTREEIENMPLPDYRSLEKVAGDFLSKPSAYFM